MNTTVNKIQNHSIVYWDITGRCNAKCKYCYTGSSSHPKGNDIDVEKFSKSINILKTNKLLSESVCFHLYVWGEPTLHPRLGDIISIIQNHGFHYMLSTNMGHVIEFQRNWFNHLDGIIVSMCGFSQESYNIIHKLDFETVRSNIINLVNNAIAAGFNTQKIKIAHHIYQFNIEEIPYLYKFAKDLNVEYHPYYAIFGDLDMTYRFIQGLLKPDEWKHVSSEIFGNQIRKRVQNNPRNGCRQFDRLVLDENCNVLTCCCLPRNHASYKISNVFDSDFIEKLTKWVPDENCQSCIKNGLSQYKGNGVGHFNVKNWEII